LVEDGSGVVGEVEEIRFGSRHDAPDVLVVDSGGLRHRRLLVPAVQVTAIDPDEGRLVISSEPHWNGPSRAKDQLPLAAAGPFPSPSSGVAALLVAGAL